jgi:hypothetical protein
VASLGTISQIGIDSSFFENEIQLHESIMVLPLGQETPGAPVPLFRTAKRKIMRPADLILTVPFSLKDRETPAEPRATSCRYGW